MVQSDDAVRAKRGGDEIAMMTSSHAHQPFSFSLLGYYYLDCGATIPIRSTTTYRFDF